MKLGRQHGQKVPYKITYCVPICRQTCPPEAILVSVGCFLIFSSEMSRQNEPKLGRKHVYKVLYKGSKVTVTLYISLKQSILLFSVFTDRGNLNFAIRPDSMLTIVICYVLCRQCYVLSWSMTFYTYDFCITNDRCMIY